MRKGSRIHNKKVSIPEEVEEERIRKTESKKAIIRAEFEKHKKEMEINFTEASKMNEIKLKNQLEELLTINQKKQENLMRLENSEHNLERENMEATQFFETVTRFGMSKEMDPYISVGCHPNRTTASIFGMRENNVAEMLGDKMSKLMETLSNIELLIEEEEKVCTSTNEKYGELKKDHILSTRKVNELKKMNDHADKRFTDLQRIEFLASTKHAAAASDLKEFKTELKGFRHQEMVYQRQKEEEMKRETEYLVAKENEMSNVLIELDKKRRELEQKKDDLKKLEVKYEEMRDKRKNNKIVSKYIETFNALDEKHENLVAAHQELRKISEQIDATKENSPYKFISGKGSNASSPFTFNLEESFTSDTIDERPKPLPVEKSSLLDRNSYIERIQKLYEKHPEGPPKLAEMIIKEYVDQCYQEESLKSNYEELQKNKKNQEHELQSLHEELRLIKGKNEYITLGRTGSKIIESNEQEAIDSGMFVIDAQPTTLNQAKFEFENKKETDNNAVLFTNTETFVLRCYLDSVEMISRLAKLLTSIYYQSGGYLSEEVKEMVRLTNIQLSILKRSKKLKIDMTASQVMAELLPELQRTVTENTNASEKEKEREPQEPIVTLDLLEVKEAFLAAFEDQNERATEFVEKLNDDVMIVSFVTIDEIKSYLQECQTDHFTAPNIQRVFGKMNKLRTLAIENMMQKLEIIYRLYSEVNVAAQQSRNDTFRYLKLKGVQIPGEDFLGRGADSNPFVQKAIHKKWQNLLERYDYDPNRDFRVSVHETEHSARNSANNQKENADANDESDHEIWDREDTKARLNEIVGVKSRKMIFKGKIEEDQKRLQAKKEKEKQRQALENMTDNDFLEWQRKQIKGNGKEELISNEMNEAELLRKYQADQALRLSSSAAPIEELRRMIENSKVLSKIQILEKQKSPTDGKRNLKFEPNENYIPHEPIKVPKSPHSANQTLYSRHSRSTLISPIKPAGRKFFATSSDMAEYPDTPKETTHKSLLPTTASRFKPIDAQFNFNSEPNADNENLQLPSKRLSTLDNFRGISTFQAQSRLTMTGSRSGKLFTESGQKQNTYDKPMDCTKHKSDKIDLPKLEKQSRKKKTEIKKNKKRKNGARMVSAEHETLNNLLKIQTDPLLKMVYSPTFFANNYYSSPAYSSEELGYKFDSFKFAESGLLISEKI